MCARYHFQVVALHSTCTCTCTCTSHRCYKQLLPEHRPESPPPLSNTSWPGQPLSSSVGQARIPLLQIHLESHTARFRHCTMAMIYLASASASASMAQFEASPSLQVLFEQVDVFCTGSIFRYCAAVRISRFVSNCDQVVPWDSGGIGKFYPDPEA